MKLMIDDSVWGLNKIFSHFGEVITLPGRQISNQSLQNCDVLIVTSRTRVDEGLLKNSKICLLYTSPSPRDRTRSRMPSSA